MRPRRCPIEIPQNVRDVIESGELAHFVTVNRDGSPHVTIVWTGLDGDEIVIAKLSVDQKVRNLRRDPRVALSMQAPSGETHGMRHYVVIEGTARVTEGGAPELLQDLAQRYIGPGAKFPPVDNPPAGFIIRVTVEKIRGMGPWRTPP